MTESAHNANNSPKIVVKVNTEYLPEQSSPEQSRYVFAYHIKIINAGEHAAQLLTRHWIIMDGEARIQEVRGDGVVGEQPRLEPGASYEYTSGTVLETPVGSMRGSYGMVDSNGDYFDAAIPIFTLAMPRVLH